MKKNFILIKIIVIYFFLISNAATKQVNYFNKGIELFQKEEFEKSKILFERDIVFNPKNERSYLYLAKIFNKEENNNLEENNLKTVILLNPKNEEAIYRLAILNIKKSDFSKTEELIKTFNLVCAKLCSSKKELQEKLKSSQKQ